MPDLFDLLPSPAKEIAATARVLLSSGLLRIERPDRFLAGVEAVRQWGTSPAAAPIVAAARTPDTVAVIDEEGSITYAELDERTNRLATALAARGVEAGQAVGVMARNHRGFAEASVALFKLGASVLYLNTGFSGPQLKDVCRSEDVAALVIDEEFADLVGDTVNADRLFLAYGTAAAGSTLDELASEGAPDPVAPPPKPARVTILTSGTTGTPKGARRGANGALAGAVGLLSKIPYRSGETMVVAAPLFHSWGMANWSVAVALSSTVVLRRRFDPVATLADLADHRARTLAVVPVMMQRMLAVDEAERARHDLSSLKVTSASGSALTGELATRWMDAFGDNLYNLYGSTEVAFATVATPDDLRAAPGTAGRPPMGTTVAIYDDDDQPLGPGQTGRIFVGNQMLFEGYTGGGNKRVINGLMATGDVGHFDDSGRLFVAGRDDDMIVSGGENVFPNEVEDLLSGHEAVADVAVIGVDDDQFGQRLAAYVVLKPGATATADDIKSFVRQHLARYKIPRDVTFLDELPRNQTGKVLKRALAELSRE